MLARFRPRSTLSALLGALGVMLAGCAQILGPAPDSLTASEVALRERPWEAGVSEPGLLSADTLGKVLVPMPVRRALPLFRPPPRLSAADTPEAAIEIASARADHLAAYVRLYHQSAREVLAIDLGRLGPEPPRFTARLVRWNQNAMKRAAESLDAEIEGLAALGGELVAHYGGLRRVVALAAALERLEAERAALGATIAAHGVLVEAAEG